MVAEARYHRCRHPGCGAAALCDKHFIGEHVVRKHRQRLTEYYQMKYDEEQPRF